MNVNNKTKIWGLGLILLMTLNTSCYYNKTPLPPAPSGDISYAADIQPIFNDNCVACHQAGTGVPLDLEESVSYNNLNSGSYLNVAEPELSVLYVKINTGGSMAPYATDNNRAVILKWIEQGALNN
jgi:mono/diheme cytochrome c family protein